MYYVLNFVSHTFQTCNTDVEVYEAIKRLVAEAKCALDDIEVVNCFGDDTRFSAKDFVETYEDFRRAGEILERTTGRRD